MTRKLKVPALLALMSVIACWPAPGRGAKAERGFQRAAPVIAALERYQAQNHRYPATLEELVPAFLTADALATPSRVQEQYPFRYTADSVAYTLEFRYAGPGMNYCRYTPQGRRWHCGGYF